LDEANSHLTSAMGDPQIDIVGPWADQVIELLRYDAQDAARVIKSAQDDRAQLAEAASLLEQRLAAWPAGADQAALFRARLDRLVEPVRYQLYLGDAWTDPAAVEVIPAPAVELQLTATPPAYAKAAVTTARDSGSRQMSALEGSRIDVS